MCLCRINFLNGPGGQCERIFETSGDQSFLPKWPKYLLKLGLFWKPLWLLLKNWATFFNICSRWSHSSVHLSVPITDRPRVAQRRQNEKILNHVGGCHSSVVCLIQSSCGPGSNPKHKINAFSIFIIEIVFEVEWEKEAGIGPYLKNLVTLLLTCTCHPAARVRIPSTPICAFIIHGQICATFVKCKERKKRPGVSNIFFKKPLTSKTDLSCLISSWMFFSAMSLCLCCRSNRFVNVSLSVLKASDSEVNLLWNWTPEF